MYFSGTDVQVFLNDIELDAVSIQFTINHPTTPVYNHSSTQMPTQMLGTKLVFGTFAVNYKEALGVKKHMKKSTNNLEIRYNREYDTILKGQGAYSKKRNTATYILHDVHLTGKQHNVSPTSENIVENFQFIAKDFIAK